MTTHGSESSKPVKITLFHAEWCGHCVDFKPTWGKMKENKEAWKNIDFEEYEAGTLSTLPEKTKKVNGEDIIGFPTIKIKIFEKEYNYKGSRDQDDIFEFVLDHLKNDKKQGRKLLKTEGNNKNTRNDQNSLVQKGGMINIRTINKILNKSDLAIIKF